MSQHTPRTPDSPHIEMLPCDELVKYRDSLPTGAERDRAVAEYRYRRDRREAKVQRAIFFLVPLIALCWRTGPSFLTTVVALLLVAGAATAMLEARRATRSDAPSAQGWL